MTLPTFFIIGAAQAGTTSLHGYLDQHPQIQMSGVEEPHFFACSENGIPAPPGRVSRLEDYEKLFDPEVEARGEASQSYTNFPRRKGVPERIKELKPDAKLIYLVRDPIARTFSQYLHWVAVGKERRTLLDVLTDFSNPFSYLTCHSLYARQLELYLRRFPDGQIKVIDQADLLADRQSVLREIFGFLAVDDTFACNQMDTEPWGRDEWYIHPRDREDSPANRERAMGDDEMRKRPWIPTLDDESRERLESLYMGEVERLRALTGLSFASWSI